MEATDNGSTWQQVLGMVRSAGEKVALEAAKVWHVAQDAATPTHVKGVLYGALAYLALPVDAVPDIVPFVGFTDDLAALSAALYAANTWITDETLARARASVRAIFG